MLIWIIVYIICIQLLETGCGIESSKIQWSDEISPDSRLYWQVTDIHIVDLNSPLTLGEKIINKNDILRVEIVDQLPERLEDFYQFHEFPTWIRTYLGDDEFEHPYSGLYKFLINPIQFVLNDSTIFYFPELIPFIPCNISTSMTVENVSIIGLSLDFAQINFTYIWNDHLDVTESYSVSVNTGIADKLDIKYTSRGGVLEYVSWSRCYLNSISGYPLYFLIFSGFISIIIIINLLQSKKTECIDIHRTNQVLSYFSDIS